MSEMKRVRIEGIFSDKPNSLGRIYPSYVVNKTIDDIRQHQNDGQPIYGQIGHPDNEIGFVELKDVSHIVQDAFVTESGELIGDVEFIDNANGDMAKHLSEQFSMVLAPAGLGTVSKNRIVQSDYKLTSLNLVFKSDEKYRR